MNSNNYRNNKLSNDTLHYNIIRKDDKNISFPNGFPNLKKNGDYHIIHAYDPSLTSDRIMRSKINQLNTWLKDTFQHGVPMQGNDNINKAGKLYMSKEKQNFMDLINWLLDPEDN